MKSGSNFDKSWLQNSINQAALARALQAMEVMGRALPCSVTAVSGSIVTVKFEVAAPPFQLPEVSIPKAESQWIRVPTQIGDYGIAIPAQTYIGAVDGRGSSSPASLALQGNLSALVFFPIASASFPAVDTTAAFICGENGAVIQDSAGNTLLKVDGQGNVTLHGVKSWGWDCDGYGERYTYQGGGVFQHDTYFLGAVVNTTAHNWTPPGPV